MARHRQPPSLRAQLWRALTRTLALTAGGSAVVLGGAGAAYVAERGGEVFPTADVIGQPAAGHERRLMTRFDCSSQGYADTAIPLSAIVRRPDGVLRVVSFDQGWRLHTEGGAGQLVAVCLRPPR